MRACAVALAAVAVLCGCTVGPNFTAPSAPGVQRYTRAPVATDMRPMRGAPSQRLRLGQAVSQRWWTLFRSAPLNNAIDTALRHSPTLAEARATLRAAEAEVAAVRGGQWPQLDASGSARRQGGGDAPAGNLYSVGATVSFDLDLFGGTRRAVEQQQALADYQRYQLAAAYLSLTGNLVTQAITLASLRDRIAATQAVVASDRRLLALVRQSYQAGKVARTDVLAAQTQLASDLAGLPPLRRQLAAARHALAVLAGQAPSAWSVPVLQLGGLRLPRELPLSLPSALVRHRPDILAAEARLHADSAAIGVATADLYPRLTLSAALDQQSLQAGTLFSAANRYWDLSAGLLAPLFHGGTLRARRRAAVETYRASLASYEATVLQALQQVADLLRALEQDAAQVDAEQRLLASARASTELERMSYLAGKTTLLNWIDAQRAYQRARLALVQARAQRLQDTAQLFVALGGGWWRAPAVLVAPKPD